MPKKTKSNKMAKHHTTASRKSRMLLAMIFAGVAALGAAIFYVNYRQSRDLFKPVQKTALTDPQPQATEQDAAAGSFGNFHYQPEKIKTGTLYHYVKSNRDGSVPENIAVYVVSEDKLEVFKYRAPGTTAGFVKAWIDWEIFSAHKLESYRVTAADEQKLVATFDFSKSDSSATTKLFLSDQPSQTTKISLLPFHIYNFDFTSLNFAFRHLVNPRDSFEIGVADLVFQNEQWSFIYRGSATVQFQAEETLHNVRCLKYSINGPGLEDRGGAIWMNEAQGHIERMDIDLPDNPDWGHFFFDLKKLESISEKEWQNFRESHFGRS